MKYFLLSALLIAVAGCAKKQADTPTPDPQQLLLGTWHLEKNVYTVPAGLSRGTHQDSVLYSPASAVYDAIFRADGAWLSGTGVAGTYNTGTYTFASPALTYSGVGFQPSVCTVTQLTSQKLVVRRQLVTAGFIDNSAWFYVR